MPDGRMLSRSISVCGQLGAVSLEADYLFARMIPHADREGRIAGDPRTIKATCCPMRDEFSVPIIERCVQELSAQGLIVTYEAQGTRVIALPGFFRHQRGARFDREASSRFPDNPDEVRSRSGLTPDEVRTNSGVGPDEVRLSEVKRSEVKMRGKQQPRTETSTTRPRKQSSARLVKANAAPAADAAADDTDRPSPRESWLAPFLATWQQYVGAPANQRTVGHLAKRFRPLVDTYGYNRLVAGFDGFCREAKNPSKIVLEWFVTQVDHWVTTWAVAQRPDYVPSGPDDPNQWAPMAPDWPEGWHRAEDPNAAAVVGGMA